MPACKVAPIVVVAVLGLLGCDRATSSPDGGRPVRSDAGRDGAPEETECLITRVARPASECPTACNDSISVSTSGMDWWCRRDCTSDSDCRVREASAGEWFCHNGDCVPRCISNAECTALGYDVCADRFARNLTCAVCRGTELDAPECQRR